MTTVTRYDKIVEKMREGVFAGSGCPVYLVNTTTHRRSGVLIDILEELIPTQIFEQCDLHDDLEVDTFLC